MSERIRHLVISVFEVEDYLRIVVFQDVEGNYLTMNIEQYKKEYYD